MNLPAAIHPMPPRSAASRRCTDCDDVDLEGTYGPPVEGTIAHLGGYARTLLSDAWFCVVCSGIRWAAWRHPDRVARRRKWVWAEVERRRLLLEVQLDLPFGIRMAS